MHLERQSIQIYTKNKYFYIYLFSYILYLYILKYLYSNRVLSRRIQKLADLFACGIGLRTSVRTRTHVYTLYYGKSVRGVIAKVDKVHAVCCILETLILNTQFYIKYLIFNSYA